MIKKLMLSIFIAASVFSQPILSSDREGEQEDNKKLVKKLFLKSSSALQEILSNCPLNLHSSLSLSLVQQKP